MNVRCFHQVVAVDGLGAAHPAMFEAQARRHWDERLRKLGVGKDFTDLAARDRTISLADDHRKEWAREIRRRAKNLDDHIVAHGIDSFVPPHWPTREGMPIPIAREIRKATHLPRAAACGEKTC